MISGNQILSLTISMNLIFSYSDGVHVRYSSLHVCGDRKTRNRRFAIIESTSRRTVTKINHFEIISKTRTYGTWSYGSRSRRREKKKSLDLKCLDSNNYESVFYFFSKYLKILQSIDQYRSSTRRFVTHHFHQDVQVQHVRVLVLTIIRRKKIARYGKIFSNIRIETVPRRKKMLTTEKCCLCSDTFTVVLFL